MTGAGALSWLMAEGALYKPASRHTNPQRTDQRGPGSVKCHLHTENSVKGNYFVESNYRLVHVLVGDISDLA